MSMHFFRFFFLSIFLFVCNAAFCTIPSSLKGIWQGNDRIIFLGGEDEISIILKEFYGWYYDRAVEPESFSKIKSRSRNSASSKNAQDYKVSFLPIPNTENTWEMTITIDKKTKNIIPIALINDEIYLDFFIKTFDEDDIYGFWQGINNADSIRISERKNNENITSWYISENGIYKLRFWKTLMNNENEDAIFSDGENIFSIQKHIFTSDCNYTCVSGKGKNIRNVEKFQKFPFDAKFDDKKKIMILGKPYLTKIKDADSKETLIDIVTQANSRRKTPPAPLFKEEELDWHWDIINELEKGNEIIQKVRERQRQFGPRPGDFQK